MADVTQILNDISNGDELATEQLLSLLYDDLRRAAERQLNNEKPGQTLQATALVHEAFVRLIGSTEQHWNSRSHFFAAAAEAMRRILVERARRKLTQKRGGNFKRADIEIEMLAGHDQDEKLLALDEALAKTPIVGANFFFFEKTGDSMG